MLFGLCVYIRTSTSLGEDFHAWPSPARSVEPIDMIDMFGAAMAMVGSTHRARAGPQFWPSPYRTHWQDHATNNRPRTHHHIDAST